MRKTLTVIAIAMFTMGLFLAGSLNARAAYVEGSGAGGGIGGYNPSAEAVCSGVNAGAGGAGCGNGDSTLASVAEKVVNIFSWIVGIVAVAVIILGGFWFITSSGDPQKVTRAKNAIIYSIVGLIVVALAQIIVRFVVSWVG